jgi:nucleotide-binding universal stress UspA family protein
MMREAEAMAPERPAVQQLEVRHVLVPLDGSEYALQAMPTARVLARRFGADLHSVTVCRAGEADRLRAAAGAALDVDPADEHVAVFTEGQPAEVITGRSTELGGCLVCMSTQGRGRLRGALVGSVARAVLERSASPIVALGPVADNPGWTPRPRSWPEPLSVPRIVACVDGSDASEQVMPVAAAWAQALGMTMTILTVIEDAPAPLRPPAEQVRRYGGRADAGSYVDALVAAWRGGAVEVDGVVVRDPIDAAGGVRAHLDARPAGLVAVTTHARSGLRRALLGAGAASIVRASVVPCVVAAVEP